MGLPTSLPGAMQPPDESPTRILTARPLVGFATRNVGPPTDVYVTVDDFLHLTLYCSMANTSVTVGYRLLRADGQVDYLRQVVTPTSDRLRNDFFINLAEGFILSVDVVTTTASIPRGSCWCEIDINRGGNHNGVDTQPLMSDYLWSGNSIGWPGSRQISSIEGPGWLHTITKTAVTAQTEQHFDVPTGARWSVKAVTGVLNTDAVAGVRQVRFRILAVGTEIVNVPCTETQGPSLSGIYNASSFGFNVLGADTRHTITFPVPFPLSAGSEIAVQTGNADIGDQWATLTTYVEEWIEPTT
jgi:hypothetical protein